MTEEELPDFIFVREGGSNDLRTRKGKWSDDARFGPQYTRTKLTDNFIRIAEDIELERIAKWLEKEYGLTEVANKLREQMK